MVGPKIEKNIMFGKILPAREELALNLHRTALHCITFVSFSSLDKFDRLSMLEFLFHKMTLKSTFVHNL